MLSHSLPQLPYSYDALEPHIDALTMEIHHSKHHQAYITNYMKLLEGTGLTEKYSPEELLQNLDEVPADKKQGIINNLWGHLNHSFFWTILSSNHSSEPRNPTGKLAEAINLTFGSFDAFKEEFTKKAMTVFWSGWAWLVKDSEGKLALRQTKNQDSPLTEGETPIIGLDVWEHAYYLKHQNKRVEYVAAFFNVIHWSVANDIFLHTPQ